MAVTPAATALRSRAAGRRPIRSTGQDGAAHSDAFLVMAGVAVLAPLVAYRMRPVLAQGETR
ncbi:hypothetical protein [Glycomyces harbinensis]|uniref:Uncharacterized protein n=1 Tax=Glycomyces harbinensis TaxID=58114 RepID=A0A1G6UB30_9ACTN|nr:hypothetical protein [Glycomyces harbinensis]SDD38600.1 hypothetical protein SAMN05216270_103409 [Glycomyces harbinensis]